MQSLRIFLAIDVSSGVKTRANDLIDQWSESGAAVNWMATEQMHLTLNFLGDVPVEETPAVCRIAKEVAAAHAPFSLTVKGAGAFPNLHSPRVVWLGVEEGSDWLKALQRDLEQRLGQAGFAIENRAYSPHLTLGRVMKSGGSLDELVAWIRRTQHYNAGPTHVDEVLVMSSVQERGSTLYHTVCRAPLGS